MLHTTELHDVRGRVHVDGDDMTYPPVPPKPAGLSPAGPHGYDVRTSTQRVDELAAAVLLLTQKVNVLERRIESMQGD